MGSVFGSCPRNNFTIIHIHHVEYCLSCSAECSDRVDEKRVEVNGLFGVSILHNS
jgi:hypothetical protein